MRYFHLLPPLLLPINGFFNNIFFKLVVFKCLFNLFPLLTKYETVVDIIVKLATIIIAATLLKNRVSKLLLLHFRYFNVFAEFKFDSRSLGYAVLWYNFTTPLYIKYELIPGMIEL